MNDSSLNEEFVRWKQDRLEKGQFPCAICQHFKSLHIKDSCVACQGIEFKETYPLELSGTYPWHRYKQMDNLTLIEWMVENKEII